MQLLFSHNQIYIKILYCGVVNSIVTSIVRKSAFSAAGCMSLSNHSQLVWACLVRGHTRLITINSHATPSTYSQWIWAMHDHFQLKLLPFGLSLVPLVFSTVITQCFCLLWAPNQGAVHLGQATMCVTKSRWGWHDLWEVEAQWLRCWTVDQKVESSNPGTAKLKQGP